MKTLKKNLFSCPLPLHLAFAAVLVTILFFKLTSPSPGKYPRSKGNGRNLAAPVIFRPTPKVDAFPEASIECSLACISWLCV